MHAFPGLGRQKLGISELKASLVYTANSRPSKLYKENLVFLVREERKGKVLILTDVGFTGYCS